MAQKWYPVIDYVACVECGTCVNFCPHHVYNKAKGPTPEDSGWKLPHGTQGDERPSCGFGCGGTC